MTNSTWAFIDYENVGTLEGIDITQFCKVYIFIGATQDKISLGSEKIDLLTEIHLLKLKAVSPDNLDFHISYYLGRFDALADAKITFVVISNDSGFDPLLSHLVETGRPCERLKTKAAVNAVKIKEKAVQPTASNEQDLVLQALLTADKNRPAKESSLINFIQSHVPVLRGDEVGAKKILATLMKHKLIKMEGKKVTYLFKKISK